MPNLEISYVNQFSANVYTLAQQKKSLLRDKVKFETITGEKRFFEQVGETEMVKALGRYSDSPIIETPFARRAMILQDFNWGDMVDKKDAERVLIDATSAITSAGSYAAGRKIDDVIISAMLGNAWAGESGTDSIALPSSQQVASDVGSSAATGFNLEKLIGARSLFGKADIDLDDPDNKLYIAISQSQLDDLLKLEKLTSADYSAVRSLVSGDIKSFMGFEFVRTNRLPLVSGVRSCIAWCKSGVALALPKGIESNSDYRADKNFNLYVHLHMPIAATRLEEKKVVEIFNTEA